MQFDTEAFIKNFIERNKKTTVNHDSLSFKSTEYTSEVPENLRLIDTSFDDLSPIAKTLLEEIKFQRLVTSSLFNQPGRSSNFTKTKPVQKIVTQVATLWHYTLSQ
jgi:hypothetical protein